VLLVKRYHLSSFISFTLRSWVLGCYGYLSQKRLTMRQAADSCVVTGRFLPCIVNLEDINTVTTEKETLRSGLFPMDLIGSVQRDGKYVA
jgi:hypothetical protein